MADSLRGSLMGPASPFTGMFKQKQLTGGTGIPKEIVGEWGKKKSQVRGWQLWIPQNKLDWTLRCS